MKTNQVNNTYLSKKCREIEKRLMRDQVKVIKIKAVKK